MNKDSIFTFNRYYLQLTACEDDIHSVVVTITEGTIALKIYDDITPALSAILRAWSTRTSCCWISFKIPRTKLHAIREKWLEEYGTGLSAEKRRYRRSKGLPCAWACALPVIGMEHQVECILLATEEALLAKSGPFSRERWKTKPPEVSDFVILRDKRHRGDSVWTWRIQNQQFGLIRCHLIDFIKKSDIAAVAMISNHIVRFYPMFGGIRRQIRRLLKEASKLWVSITKSGFPGPNPELLPMMIGFKKEP